MNDTTLNAARFGVLAAAVSVLGGCGAQALTAISNSMLTPEKAGISTSTWRGKSCSELASSRRFLEGEQRKDAAIDAQSAQIDGWMIDSIDQVRREQGCMTAGATDATAPPVKVTAYGYCIASTLQHVWLTPVFTYTDYFIDSGAAETAAFQAMIASTYGVTDGHGACGMEDSYAKAQAFIDRSASQTTLQLGRSTIHTGWTPPAISKAPPVAAAVPVAPVVAAQPVARVEQSSSTLGFKLESLGPELVKAFGLPDANGAWVVAVTPDSAAAKAGIKPMDVILDISGQVVAGPDEVMAISGKMRAGYAAKVNIWRARKAQELTLVIPAG